MSFTVLVECHHSDARLLTDGHLDVDPLKHRQEHWVRERLEKVTLGIDVNSEACLGVVPEREALIEAEYVIVLSSFGGIRLKSVLTEVLDPERCRVANIALLVLEAWDCDAAKFAAHCTVELRYIYLLGGYGIAEGRRNVLLNKLRQSS